MTHPVFTEEHDLIRAQLRRFVEERVKPHGAKWEEAGFVPRDVLAEMGALGFFSLRVPEALGGAGLDARASVVLAEEVGRSTHGGFAITVLVHTDMASPHLVRFGTRRQLEKYLPGIDYRRLVVGRTLVAAARRDPPLVIGDGVHTVRQLVDQVNADPKRGEGHATSLTKIRFDDIARARLKEQGMDETSVPALGQRVVLRNNANLSTGGTATDVTDEVHPEVAARAIAAARWWAWTSAA
ncbi:MAG: acyl-CoA dehydrogenase family protein, partial [Reyranella sp.]|nr:acyl-CoA dehydrogenase family protein [Reyranella sp.]